MYSNLHGPEEAREVKYLQDISQFDGAQKAILLACIKEHYQESTHRMIMLLSQVDGAGSYVRFLACMIAQYYHRTNVDIPRSLQLMTSADEAQHQRKKGVLKLFLKQIDKGFKIVPEFDIDEKLKQAAKSEVKKWLHWHPDAQEKDKEYFYLACLGNELANAAEFRKASTLYNLANDLASQYTIIAPNRLTAVAEYSAAYDVGAKIYEHNVRVPDQMVHTLNELHKVPSEHELYSRQRSRAQATKSPSPSAPVNKPSDIAKPAEPEVVLEGKTLFLKNFQYLNFYNQLGGLDYSSIESVVIVKATLDLRPLPAEFFQRYTNISRLTIKDSKLASLEGIDKLKNLQHVMITELLIPRHDLPRLDVTLLQRHTKLKTIDITSGRFYLSDPIFSSFHLLSHITLSGFEDMKIDESFWSLPHLTKVSLSNCNLTALRTPQDLSKSLIEDVILTNNQLTEIPIVLLQVPRLKRLWLAFNNVAQFPEGITAPDTLQDVRLAQNPMSKIEAEVANARAYFDKVKV